MNKVCVAIVCSFCGIWSLTAQTVIPLRNCVNLDIVILADISSSMRFAREDICAWVRTTRLIPADDGSVELSLYSFGDMTIQWSPFTGNRQQLVAAADSICAREWENSTMIVPAIKTIMAMLDQRRIDRPGAQQILLIQSDYEFDPRSRDSFGALLYALHQDGVMVILATPHYCAEPEDSDGFHPCRDAISGMSVWRDSLHGAIPVWGDLNLFSNTLSGLEPEKPCN